jgi:V/A-type H+-transporting ATPase subunit I
VLGAMQNLKDGFIKKFITHQLSWFIIQPPAALLIGHSLLKIWVISDSMMIISLIVLTIGLFILFIGYLGLAPFEITGYLGDWLSFARLIALSLATIGMALTINIIGELILSSGYNSATFVLSLIIAAVFLGFIHLINFVLQTLGAAIHSLRLQYIELFNRCYEGGGTPFKPFYSNRSYTKIKPNLKKIK